MFYLLFFVLCICIHFMAEGNKDIYLSFFAFWGLASSSPVQPSLRVPSLLSFVFLPSFVVIFLCCTICNCVHWVKGGSILQFAFACARWRYKIWDRVCGIYVPNAYDFRQLRYQDGTALSAMFLESLKESRSRNLGNGSRNPIGC